jgi:hypothetical protein
LKVNKYVLVGLVIVVIVAVYLTFFTGAKKKIASVAAPLDPPKAAVPQQPEMRAKEARVEAVQSTMQWERDPFTLPTFLLVKKESEKQAEKQRAPMKLTAIMEGRKGRVAIIDNEVVAKGDVIAGERVFDIGKDSVTLSQDGSKRVIAIQEPK